MSQIVFRNYRSRNWIITSVGGRIHQEHDHLRGQSSAQSPVPLSTVSNRTASRSYFWALCSAVHIMIFVLVNMFCII